MMTPPPRRQAIISTISTAIAIASFGTTIASPPHLNEVDGLRFPWLTKAFSTPSSSSPLMIFPRGGDAAAKKRPVMKGSASSSPTLKRGFPKKKKKKRVVRKAGLPKLPAEKLHVGGRSSAATGAAVTGDTMPSIFRMPSEEKYDRYAAALAVTEGLRRVRDAEIMRVAESTRKKSWLGGMSVGRREKDKLKARVIPLESAKKWAESAFLLQSTKAVRALGMTVTQFNQIGREVMNDPALKERVSEQAYLYRIASAIQLEKVPLLEDPSSKKLIQSQEHKKYRVQLFARSIHEIEDLRADQMEALRQSLQVDQFPKGFDLSDPNVQPFLHPDVRQVCEKFPIQAEEIVKQYGLDSNEFNRMLEETQGNPIFRWRVQKYVEKAGEEQVKEKT